MNKNKIEIKIKVTYCNLCDITINTFMIENKIFTDNIMYYVCAT